MRRAALSIALVVGLVLVPGVASASWSASAFGSASTRAETMPGAAAPSASVSGSDVTLSWSASAFSSGDPIDGYRVRRYDVVSGSPQAVLSGCDGTVAATACTEVGVPDGQWVYTLATVKGPWTGVEGAPSATVSVTTHATGPTVSATVIAKTQGGTPGSVRQGGTYHLYANASDPDGVASITADVSAITAGQNAVPLAAGSYAVGGITYGYRSGSLTAGTPLAEGAVPYSVTATDGFGNPATAGGSVTIDNTAPYATDVQTANASGGTVGRAEAGDTLTLSLSEPIEPGSVLAAWTGGGTAVTVRLVDGTSSDSVQIWNVGNTTQVPLGTIALGRTDYTSQMRQFSGSTMTLSGSIITIVLGSPGGGVRTAGGTGTMTWTPVATPYDRAANGLLPATITETGTPDVEF